MVDVEAARGCGIRGRTDDAHSKEDPGRVAKKPCHRVRYRVETHVLSCSSGYILLLKK